MNNQLHTIYCLFLEYAYLNGCLIFEENEFKGIFLKKDLEQMLKVNDHFIIDKKISISSDNIEDILFNQPPNLKMRIPYINFNGQILGLLLYEEFVSEFFPQDFQTKLSLVEIFDYHEHPILILNIFKTILYLNNKAQDLLSQEAFGKKISNVLLGFQMSFDNHIILTNQDNHSWYLTISHSFSTHATYQIYQFIPIQNKDSLL
ncbi:MAG: hypothetical protein ACRCTQ_03825 [Brevinemataceae bacterium]